MRVVARIANDRAAEPNRCTFSESFRFEWGFDADEAGGPNLFPAVVDPDDPTLRGDDLGGCVPAPHWSLVIDPDPLVRVPDGSGKRATILHPSPEASQPGCMRKSYES